MKTHWQVRKGKVYWRDLCMSAHGLVNCLEESNEFLENSQKEVDKLRKHLYNIHERYKDAGFVFFESAAALEGDEL